MRSIDTSAARMDALASAIRELVPTLVSIQRRHGLKVAQLASRPPSTHVNTRRSGNQNRR